MAWGDPPGTQDLGLATEPSSLQKVLEFLSRPNYAKNAVLKDLITGKGDMGADVMTALKGGGGPQGADIIDLLSGGPAQGTTGKVLRGIGGFAGDVLTDPLNLLQVAPVAKGAEALEKSGEMAPGVFNQMRQGQRAAASLGGIETPDFVNKLVGEVGGRAGNMLNALPGADMVKEMFTPAYTKLRTVVGKMNAGAQDFITNQLGGGQDIDEIKNLFRKGAQTINEDIPEELNKAYDAQGLTPMEKMFEEVYRKSEADLVGNQNQLVKSLIDEAGKALKTGDLETAKANTKLLDIIDKYPSGENTFGNDAVNKISEMLGAKNEALLQARKAAGYDTSELENYIGRSITPEAKELLSKRGGMNAGMGGPLGGPTQAERVFKEFTKQQVEQIFQDDFLRQKMFGVTEPIDSNKNFWQAMTNPADEAGKHAAEFYERNPLTSYGYQLQNTAKAVSSAGAIKDIVKNFGSDTPEALVDKGAQPVLVNIPGQLSKIVGKDRVWMDSAVAGEFNKLTTTLSNPKYINSFLRVWDNVTNAFKVGTLFGSPLVGLPTSSKYLMGHMFIAWMKDGISSAGVKFGAQAARDVMQRESLLDEGPEGIQKWKQIVDDFPTVETPSGPINPLKVAEDTGILRAGNKYDLNVPDSPIKNDIIEGIKKYTGTNLSMKVAEGVDTYARIQYLTTRLLQGYAPEKAALMTIRDLYDYTGGLSPFEQNVMRRLIPFYSWMRFNIPSMLMATIQHPGKAANVEHFIDNMEATIGKPQPGQEPDERVLDQFINGQLHMRVYQDASGKWHYFTLQHYLPLADLEGFGSVHNALHEVGAALNPLIKSPVELLTNKSLTFEAPGGQGGQEIERYPGETTNFLGLPLERKYANLISENLRPLNEINSMNPGGIFGNYKEQNALGALREQTQRTPFEQLMRTVSIHFTPVDWEHSAVNSHYAFERALQQLNIGEKRAERMGKENDVQNLEQMKQKLFDEAIPL